MTLNALRLYYGLLVLADQALWSLTPLSLAVMPWAVWLADGLRVALLLVAVLPRRFRLVQVRALRWISLWAFLQGACAAWSARAGFGGQDTAWLVVISPKACEAAFLLAVGCVTVLIVNAVLLPRTRWL